ncbi:MAG: helix-turn-helix domain-containing protein [Oscillospiraceae bacterium]|nr:helix-turn-helix domain-containing protein [Oscillospiraceae bacterium]
MDITLEVSCRGSDVLPLGLYRQQGAIPGAYVTPLQYHKDLEIFLSLEGSTQVVIDGESMETQPNTLYFINPYQPHSMQIAAPPSRYDCLLIPAGLLSFPPGHAVMADLIGPIFDGKLSFVRQSQDPYLIELFQRITANYDEKEQNAAGIIGNLLLFLDHCQKHGLLQKTADQPTQPIRKAVDYIQQNFQQKLTLTQIAATTGMNEKYFCSYFKKHTHTTPIAYLTMLRIRQAKVLLRENRLSVLEVAFSCGFDNVSFFIRQFKAATGQTPGQYRKSVCQ